MVVVLAGTAVLLSCMNGIHKANAVQFPCAQLYTQLYKYYGYVFLFLLLMLPLSNFAQLPHITNAFLYFSSLSFHLQRYNYPFRSEYPIFETDYSLGNGGDDDDDDDDEEKGSFADFIETVFGADDDESSGETSDGPMSESDQQNLEIIANAPDLLACNDGGLKFSNPRPISFGLFGQLFPDWGETQGIETILNG